MKKIISIIIAAALMLSMCIIGVNAEEETNVALNKPVIGEIEGNGTLEITLGFWKLEYLTDGVVPEFPGSENQDRLGWYSGNATRDVDMTVTIDLEDLYDLSRVYIVPQKFIQGTSFPSSYTVEISADGSNWTKVGEENDLEGVREEAMTYGFNATAAQYVKFHMTLLSTITDGSLYYGGLGEIEAYGVKHVEAGLRDFDSAKGDKLSYDQILVNGTQIANGNDAVIAAKALIDGSDGSVSNISMHGWFGNANSKVASYGYIIDDAEPVYGDFAATAEQAVIDAGGDSRYTVTVDVSELQDGAEHVIWVVAKLENGAIVKLNRYDNRGQDNGKDREVYVNYTAPAAQPATEPAGEYTYNNASFDSFYVNDVLNFGKPDGAASEKLDEVERTVDGSDGSVTRLALRGWIGFAEEIESFGYQINGENVFGDFAADTEQAVKDAGGANASRFHIEIDASALKGTNNIVAIVKLANGAVVKLDETLVATGPATPPNTSFTFIGVPATEPATEDVPQTGDAAVAMFAVIAVLAMGAAVVFVKKRAF